MIASMVARMMGGGGSDAVVWRLFDSCDQASNTPVDAGGLSTSRTFTPATGKLQIAFSTVTTSHPGFRNNHVYVTESVSTLLPGFDPDLHELVAYVSKGDTDSGTGEILCSLSLIDESTPTGTAQGVGGGWTQSSASTDAVSVVQATSASASNEANAPCQGAFLRWAFTKVSTTWACNFTVRGDPTGTDAPAPNPVNNNYVRSNPKNCYLMLSVAKRLGDNLSGQNGEVVAWVGYRSRGARPN